MLRTAITIQRDAKRCYVNCDHIHWNELVQLVLQYDKHLDFQILQNRLPPIPDYFESRLADYDGQIEDYGYALDDGKGIHLKVYEEGFYRIHWDAKDPNKDPFGHLLYDATKYVIGGIAVAAIAGIGYGMYKSRKKPS